MSSKGMRLLKIVPTSVLKLPFATAVSTILAIESEDLETMLDPNRVAGTKAPTNAAMMAQITTRNILDLEIKLKLQNYAV